jgi:hypothetical protein
LSRLATSFVLGYHGCDRADGERFLSGEEPLKAGYEPYHWLGPGIYFWEGDPLRALEWAESKQKRNACKEPFVVVAVIDLGNCLDFQTRENVALLKLAYESFESICLKAGVELPVNKRAKNDKSPSKVLRYLDFAVISHLIKSAEEEGTTYDTVRGVFGEGVEAYPGSGILDQSHSQIAVRNPDSIKGVFRVRFPDGGKAAL